MRFTILERGNVGLAYGISFVLVGTGTRKLLKVKVENLGYFWVLIAKVTFSFKLSYFLDSYSYFLLPV